MKAIDVKDQVRLPLGKCVSLVLSGVRFRLFRAAITVLIISLAVTFLMTMLGESIVGRRVAAVIDRETAPRDNFLFWANRVSTPMSAPELIGLLDGLVKDGDRWQELRVWGGSDLSDAALAGLAKLATAQTVYEKYFSDIDPGERRPLIGLARGEAIFEILQAKEEFERFRKELRNISRQVPTSVEEFKSFLGEWARTKVLREGIRQGHRKAVTELKTIFGDATAKEVLAKGEFSFRQALLKRGFRISEDEYREVSDQAGLARDGEQIGSLAGILWFKAMSAEKTGVELQAIDSQKIFSTAASTSGAKWLLANVDELKQKIAGVKAAKARVRKLEAEIRQVRQDDPDSAELKAMEKRRDDMKLSTKDENLISPASRRILDRASLATDRIVAVARYERRQRALAGVEATVARSTGTDIGWLGFPVRTMWLLVVSFVVCIVGIANAMLMSVTERFREIATMKCLGATDGFIMINFILESIMQGVAGSAVGAILGLLLGALRGWARFGQIALSNLPVVDLLSAAALSFGIGVLISAMAAVYPARVAAKLAPMEAMRIE